MDDAYIAARKFEQDMYPVRFLHMEDINRQLHDFLVESGHRQEDVAFVLEQGKVAPEGPARADGSNWSTFYTPELKARVRHRERLLFALFPEYDD